MIGRLVLAISVCAAGLLGTHQTGLARHAQPREVPEGSDAPDEDVPIDSSGNQQRNDDDSLLNGYYWYDGNWVPGLITVGTWFTATPAYTSGGAVFYGPNVMEGTARWRGMPLEGYLDGIAMMSPADIGATVWIRRPGLPWEGPYLVVDTAGRIDAYPVVTHRREVIEVGFQTALRWGMVEGGDSGWHTTQWVIPDVEVLKSERLPAWAAEQSDHGPLTYYRRVLRGASAIPINYPVWYEAMVEFSTEWEAHPYYVRPAQWNMRDGRPPISWFDFPMQPPLFMLDSAVEVRN